MSIYSGSLHPNGYKCPMKSNFQGFFLGAPSGLPLSRGAG